MVQLLKAPTNFDEKLKLYNQALSRFQSQYNPETFGNPSALIDLNKKISKLVDVSQKPKTELVQSKDHSQDFSDLQNKINKLVDSSLLSNTSPALIDLSNKLNKLLAENPIRIPYIRTTTKIYLPNNQKRF